MRPPIRNRKRRRGSAIVEFTLAGIAGVMLLMSTVQISLVLWNYHTLAYAVHETNRYIASHGRSCTTGGNACAITVGQIATKFSDYAMGIPGSDVSLLLTAQSGAAFDCTPLSNYKTDTTQWPPVPHSDNYPGRSTTVTAKVTLHPAILMIWFGATSTGAGTITLPATSNIPIVF
jgi:Flp pilus assembly protein TadG